MNEVAKILSRWSRVANIENPSYARYLKLGAKEIERLEQEIAELKDNVNDYAELCEEQRERINELETEHKG